MSHSFECGSPGRQVVQQAVVHRPVGIPEIYQRLSCDQTRRTAPVSHTRPRRTEKQIETVFGVAYIEHIPVSALDISNLAEDRELAFHPFSHFHKSTPACRKS